MHKQARDRFPAWRWWAAIGVVFVVGAVSGPASAEPPRSRWYIGGGLGVGGVHDLEERGWGVKKTATVMMECGSGSSGAGAGAGNGAAGMSHSIGSLAALIAPHKRDRKRPPTQDGRPLRRYRRRWQVERLVAWLQNYRRILTRFEYYADNYLGCVHLGCLAPLLFMRPLLAVHQ